MRTSCRPARSIRMRCICPVFSCTASCASRRTRGDLAPTAAGAAAMSETKGLTRQQMADRIALAVRGRLDRQSRRRHSDPMFQHRHRRPPHHLSFRERRDRLWPGRAGGRGRPEPGECRRAERHAEAGCRGGASRRQLRASSAAATSM